jgi:hypothetical protein
MEIGGICDEYEKNHVEFSINFYSGTVGYENQRLDEQSCKS